MKTEAGVHPSCKLAANGQGDEGLQGGTCRSSQARRGATTDVWISDRHFCKMQVEVPARARKSVGVAAANPAPFSVWHSAPTRAAEEGGVALLGHVLAAHEYVEGRVAYRVNRGAEHVHTGAITPKATGLRCRTARSQPKAPLAFCPTLCGMHPTWRQCWAWRRPAPIYLAQAW
jgi:hypothetical protein